jgi:hypothetical protein
MGKMGKKTKRRSFKVFTYHGRKGHPIIHLTEEGREFIMVRKKGGGTKRLYLTYRAERLLTSKKGYRR